MANQSIVGEKCIQNKSDAPCLAVKEKRDAWRHYYKRLMNVENA